MKYILTTILLFGNIVNALCQLPHWVIKPTNDTLYIVDGSNIIRGEEKGKTAFWALDGKLLYSTDHKTNEFSSRIATIQNRENGDIVGFINHSGHFTKLPDVSPAYDHPYFENGILVAKRNDEFVLFTKDGHELHAPQINTIYPFSHGYAPYLSFRQPDKLKNPYYNYLKPDGSSLQSFIIEEQDKEKVIEPKDVQFLSALDDSEKGLAIVKNKLYWFIESNYSLRPILMGDETEKKRHLTLDNKQLHDFTNIDGKGLSIHAKYSKDKLHTFEFDNKLRLIGQTSKQDENKAKHKESKLGKKSHITVYSNNNLYGLIFNSKDSLPCQFEQVGQRYGNCAFVKSNGKWGIVEIAPNSQLDLMINNDMNIIFRHNSIDTQLRIDLPASLPGEGFNIVNKDYPDLELEFTSKECNNSKRGNTVTYPCILNAPIKLSDEMTDLTYGPIAMTYEDIQLPDRHIKAKGRYENPYNIDLETNDASVSKGVAEFKITVKTEGDAVFPFEVTLATDSLPSKTEKMSDNIYICSVSNLKCGVNSIGIKITEKGCPECVFPIEIVYSIQRKKESATVRLKNNTANSYGESEIEFKEDAPSNPVSGNDGDSSAPVVTERTKPSEPPAPATDRNAKKRIWYDEEYFVGEVIADNVNLRSGPGKNYPKSTYTSLSGKEEVSPLYSGTKIKIKESDDWYRVYSSLSVEENSDPQYVLKKFVKPVESKAFYLDEISSPTTYVKITQDTDDSGKIGNFAEVLTLYPGGLFVSYSESFYENGIGYGTLADGDAALKFSYTAPSSYEKTTGTKKGISSYGDEEGLSLGFEIPSTDVNSITTNKNISYPNISIFSEEDWRLAIKNFESNEYFNKSNLNYRITDSFPLFITRDELEKTFTKVN